MGATRQIPHNRLGSKLGFSYFLLEKSTKCYLLCCLLRFLVPLATGRANPFQAEQPEGSGGRQWGQLACSALSLVHLSSSTVVATTFEESVTYVNALNKHILGAVFTASQPRSTRNPCLPEFF